MLPVVSGLSVALPGPQPMPRDNAANEDRLRAAVEAASDDAALRLNAMRLAVSYASKKGYLDPAKAVASAEAFYKFLKGA